ncbi:uncharacterized protein BYT42DRAFT_560546 [Radiomyces spectabilis]|uniref:uncharacterized protein n=1 Tax=Radiomyces spectabilis TaxID=64574 RepID=UPI0022201C47|nr:uncharacterized protein BYT42DRAFT_560546 [Radiomyces spectabilis]KAI8388572.1 hypothetical protein BYT42DRAFT_560546 [Radiomyces spectabilis]
MACPCTTKDNNCTCTQAAQCKCGDDCTCPQCKAHNKHSDRCACKGSGKGKFISDDLYITATDGTDHDGFFFSQAATAAIAASAKQLDESLTILVLM